MNMIRHLLLALGLALAMSPATLATDLEQEFHQPSDANKIAVFWFWANTVTKEGIHRDLEAMKQAGIGRVVLGMTKAHSATVETGGVVFLSPEWLALFRYALDEAAKPKRAVGPQTLSAYLASSHGAGATKGPAA